jgi:AraC-like DNA-binding protein
VVTIAALVSDRGARARLREATRGQAEVVFCESVSDLVSTVADGAAATVVTEWRVDADATVDAAVRSLHADYPSVPILVYAPLTPQGARDMLAATRAGACEVLIANFDDIGVTLGQRIALAQSSALANQIASRIAGLVPGSIALMMDYFFRQARRAPTVATAAQALGVHRKTLASHCARAGLPSPSALSCWARLILAAQRLEDPGRTTDRAAIEMGFPSGSAFRNMLKRYTGLSPSEVRERGGSVCIAELLTGRLVAAQAKLRLAPPFGIGLSQDGDGPDYGSYPHPEPPHYGPTDTKS